jgi:peptide/nickel transport system permease protein
VFAEGIIAVSVSSKTTAGNASNPKDGLGGSGAQGSLFARLRSNQWVRFLLRRLASLLLVLVALAIATFLMVRLIPGDPALIVGGLTATGDQLTIIRHQLGIDVPIQQQFINYWINLAHGDLGTSFVTHQPVTEVITQRISTSLQLAASALALVMLFSIPAGMISGSFTREGRRKRLEVCLTAVTSIVGALPEYLAGTFLAFAFAVSLRVLPVAGSEGWQSLVLPALAISLRPMAILTRLVRVETLNVLAMDYMRTARSKRLPARLIYVRHALPNVVTAALTIGGILFAGIIGGAVVVENVFARAGLGTALVGAVLSRDYPVIQGIILILGIIVVSVNATVDLLLALVDPRSITRQS